MWSSVLQSETQETVVVVDQQRKLFHQHISSSVVLNEADGTMADRVKDKVNQMFVLSERRSGILLV